MNRRYEMWGNRKTGRRRARSRRAQVIDRFGRICFWCGCDLVVLQAVNKKCVIRMDATTVTYRDHEGHGHTSRIFTLDHVVPRGEGGSDEASNLVPSCVPCNLHRNALQHPGPGRSRTCPKCGGLKDPKRRKCLMCRLGYFGPDGPAAATKLATLLDEARKNGHAHTKTIDGGL